MNQTSCDVIQTTPKVPLQVSNETITRSRVNSDDQTLVNLIYVQDGQDPSTSWAN
jgi:hypothetical protein